jgi:putative endonuclease
VRYGGTFRLRARRAPHSSELLVENFPVSTSARLWRRLLSLLVVCAVLMLSMYVVQQATAAKAAVQAGQAATTADSAVCTLQLSAGLQDFRNASQVRDSVANAVARANGSLPVAWMSCFCRGYGSMAGWAKLYGAIEGLEGGNATGLSAAQSARPCQAYAWRTAQASLLYYGAPSGGEVDIVCRHHHTLTFVEVKTRTRVDHRRPADAVTQDKQHLIQRGARAWLRLLPKPVAAFRFDIAEVILTEGELPHVNVIENAFQLPAGERLGQG